jgi:hypothetical protein
MGQYNDISRIDSDFGTVCYAVNTSSSRSVAITTQSGIVRIATKATEAHIKFGDGTVTATTNDLLMPPNHVEFFSFKSGDHIAFIRSSSSAGDISITAID